MTVPRPSFGSSDAERAEIATVEVTAPHVVVAGEIDMSSSQLLAVGLDAAIHDGGPVFLDLGAVTFMDAAGLRVLTSAAIGTDVDRGLDVVAASPMVQRLFALAGGADAILRRAEFPTGR